MTESGDDNLGLTCSGKGLFLGRTPLIEWRHDRFIVRDCGDIERLLARAYRTEIAADRLMPGLATVASALNAHDVCLACIAAVHLRLPELTDRIARDDLEAADALIKYARDEADGTGWDAAKHPRIGEPPNPGWFAVTGRSSEESSPARAAANDDPARRSDAMPSAGRDPKTKLTQGLKTASRGISCGSILSPPCRSALKASATSSRGWTSRPM